MKCRAIKLSLIVGIVILTVCACGNRDTKQFAPFTSFVQERVYIGGDKLITYDATKGKCSDLYTPDAFLANSPEEVRGIVYIANATLNDSGKKGKTLQVIDLLTNKVIYDCWNGGQAKTDPEEEKVQIEAAWNIALNYFTPMFTEGYEPGTSFLYFEGTGPYYDTIKNTYGAHIHRACSLDNIPEQYQPSSDNMPCGFFDGQFYRSPLLEVDGWDWFFNADSFENTADSFEVAQTAFQDYYRAKPFRVISAPGFVVGDTADDFIVYNKHYNTYSLAGHDLSDTITPEDIRFVINASYSAAPLGKRQHVEIIDLKTGEELQGRSYTFQISEDGYSYMGSDEYSWNPIVSDALQVCKNEIMRITSPEESQVLLVGQFHPAEGAIGIVPYSQYAESMNNPGDTDLLLEDVRFVVMGRTILDLVTGEKYEIIWEEKEGYVDTYRGLLAMLARSEGANTYLVYDADGDIWHVADDIIPDKYRVHSDKDAQHVGGMIRKKTGYYSETATYKDRKGYGSEEKVSFTFQTVSVTIIDIATGEIIAEEKFYPHISHAPYSVIAVDGKVKEEQNYDVDESEVAEWIEKEWEEYLLLSGE